MVDILKNIMNIDFIIFAYEPIYAIGTGTLPRIDKIKEVISFTSKYLQDKYNKKPTIIYGGSVDSSNIKEILNIDNVDGVLIGSMSSNVKEVERMINNIESRSIKYFSIFSSYVTSFDTFWLLEVI